jgi:segregation and condensation protein A
MSFKTYEVHLEIFEGPLDLLLHLIKKDDLEIGNIPIAEITKEYLGYLDLMKELNLEVAGDFLVMASTLMQIKAKSLLPSQIESPEEGPDPRTELVNRLVEYQKFKEAATFLEKRGDDFRDVFFRGVPNFAERDKSLNIRIFDLLSTLREVLDRTQVEEGVVAAEEHRIEEKIEKILSMLDTTAYIRLIDVFKGERSRRAVLTCFMALLELIKTQRIFARQERAFADILIYKKLEPVNPVWPGATEDESPASSGANGSEGAVGASLLQSEGGVSEPVRHVGIAPTAGDTDPAEADAVLPTEEYRVIAAESPQESAAENESYHEELMRAEEDTFEASDAEDAQSLISENLDETDGPMENPDGKD